MEHKKIEKVTVNLNVVDIGYIDLLVEQGIFSNRTDFIRDAVRNKLDTNKHIIDKSLKAKDDGKSFCLGIKVISESELKKTNHAHEMNDLVVVGLLIIPNTVQAQYVIERYKSINVYGTVRCSKEIREHYGL